MNQTLNYKNILTIAVLIALLGIYFVISQKPGDAVGSALEGQEYKSTTTSATFLDHSVLKTGAGSLAQVVITGTSPARITIFDATTTDTTKRTRAATTTLASFQTTATPGTYTFDSIFTDGILVDFSGGTGSTTITWR